MAFLTLLYTMCKELLISILHQSKQTTEYIGTWASTQNGLLDFKTPYIMSAALVQTMLSMMKTWTLTRESVDYKRTYLRSVSNKLIALDWIKTNSSYSDLVLICPGIGGRSSDKSVLQIVNNIRKYNEFAVTPYNVVVYNRATEFTMPSFPDIDELDYVMHFLTSAGYKVTLVGLSAAGNLVLGYAGRKGKECLAEKVVAVSSAVDLVTIRTKIMFNKDIDNLLYTKNGIWHTDKSLIAMETEMVKASHACIYKYYDSISTTRLLKYISVPTLYIASRDDPLLDNHQINLVIDATKGNMNLNAVITSHGSHIDWVEPKGGVDWLTRAILHFIRGVPPVCESNTSVRN